MDFLNSEDRSKRMRLVLSKNTKPELQLRKALHKLGFRFRLHSAHLPGKPDIILPKYHAVVFVHGCFWHRHEFCKLTTTPASNREFWNEKFEKNIRRDKKTVEELQALNWRVFVVWQCDLSRTKIQETGIKLANEIKNHNSIKV